MKWRSLDESAVRTDARPLREVFAERKELIAKYVPRETRDLHARAMAELKKRRIAANVLPIGAKAPSFELQNHDGKLVSMEDRLSKGPLVLCFIRGRWCPYCVAQMEAMNLLAPQIERAGASLIAVSPQTVQQSFFMHNQHKLRFDLLSDPGNRVARQFGLVYRVPDYQQAVYQRVFINLPFVNGDESWELPIPATFILNSGHTIRYASADEDCTERPEPAEIFQQLATFP